mmetsp:Transcript_18319/g.45891  ORF Transcript_18319/g.45891 Transcript_18319/m.45891 type:complete len:105 (+) Transcript_18319:1017-1331(+)
MWAWIHYVQADYSFAKRMRFPSAVLLFLQLGHLGFLLFFCRSAYSCFCLNPSHVVELAQLLVSLSLAVAGRLFLGTHSSTSSSLTCFTVKPFLLVEVFIVFIFL